VADLQDEAISRLKRQLAGCIEVLTKQLEALDGLSLADASDELRQRRKTTVHSIQVHCCVCSMYSVLRCHLSRAVRVGSGISLMHGA